MKLHMLLIIGSPVPIVLPSSCRTVGSFLYHGGGDGRRQNSDGTSLVAATDGSGLHPHFRFIIGILLLLHRLLVGIAATN